LQSSQSEALRQKNDLLKEVDTLRCELQQVRDDRDHKAAEINTLLVDLSAHKELTGKTSMEIENILTRCGALEV
jgi:kinesin family protein C1